MVYEDFFWKYYSFKTVYQKGYLGLPESIEMMFFVFVHVHQLL